MSEENEEPENKSIGKVGFGAFNVKAKSDEGVKVPLSLPDGTETDEYLVVRGTDSKAFVAAQTKHQRATLKLAKDKEKDTVGNRKVLARKLVASLVAGWSFEDMECNEENVIKFFETAPQIQDEVDKFAIDRSNFFVKPPSD